ncbi:hypothetical protein OF83DRAFT_443312 [Amylostereum chailletii]|nr:hypothetical protein OF83DRAFT_443312 [Amylostereum chailletii]
MASEPPSTIEPPRKRARENSESTESDTPDVKSAQLWFTDGNIILRTVSNATTPQRTVYKVHKSVLALHATFFRDLFDGPQAAFVTGSESYEDLPLMDMPDSQMDVESFLKALYFPEYTRRHYASPRLKSLPEGYAGILRMATKYDAENLRETVVAAFKKLWPSKLTEWLELQKYIDDEAKLEDVAGTMVNVSSMYADLGVLFSAERDLSFIQSYI